MFTRRKAVKDKEQWEEWRLTVLHKFSVASRLTRRSDILLIKSDPVSLAKANLSLWGGKGVSAIWFNSQVLSSIYAQQIPQVRYRLVLFFPFRCCFAGSLPFSLSTVKQTKLFHSISEMFFTFLARKTLLVKLFSLNVCEAALPAAIKGGNFGAKLTHLCGFWLDVSFFSHVKKHRSRFWLDESFFSRVKTIVRSSDWLELICVRKFTT